jgi:protein ImuA
MAARDVIADLSQRIRMIERTGRRCATAADLIANGLPGLERLFCNAGWPRGGLVEWLAEGRGSGSMCLALWASRAAWHDNLLVMIDSQRELHAPAAMPFAVDLSKTVFIRPERPPDALWSLEQVLRTRGIGAVVCDVEQLSPQACRRLQLAAETGGGLGILLRPAKARGQPSFAEYRFLVQPLPPPDARRAAVAAVSRRWRVELLRGRKQLSGNSVIVELSDGPNGLSLAAELASATPAA